MNIQFVNKRILVTGASGGIGLVTVKKLLECGAEVVAMVRNSTLAQSLKGLQVNVVECDLANWDETKKAVEKNGPYHGVVNMAGVAILEPFLEANPESFDKVFDVNVKAMLNVSQVAAKKMIENRIQGSIVNISSQASQAALKDHAVYCASKGAVDMLSKVMALELGPFGIRVNTVNPTVVMTAMGRLGWEDPAKGEPMKAKIPLGRFAEVEEVTHAVLYLLSDFSSMINGVSLPVDGGFLAT